MQLKYTKTNLFKLKAHLLLILIQLLWFHQQKEQKIEIMKRKQRVNFNSRKTFKTKYSGYNLQFSVSINKNLCIVCWIF